MKLYFRYGAMSAAKTLNLLAVRHNYISQGKKVFLIKPALDLRFDGYEVSSRAGVTAKADWILLPEENINIFLVENYDCILVDEAQFLSEKNVDSLRSVAKHVPVICYGLRTDFQKKLFPGSKRLFELSDSIEEIKTVCELCNKKALFNARLDSHGNIVTEGDQIQAGFNYKAVCWEHSFTRE